jgi:digeranylgeranylglycerophospholipid reductase
MQEVHLDLSCGSLISRRVAMKLEKEYDVVVVGAGPAGSMAAYMAASAGVSVLLLEKDREIGIPVRCAEAVGKDGIEKVLGRDIDPRWIATEISRFQFVAPDGTSIYPKVNMTGYVLHRKIFDFDLAVRAADAGATILTHAYVNGLKIKNGAVTGVTCTIDHDDYEFSSKIVIGADGVETRVGRWAGLKTTISMNDMESCSQMTLANLDIDANMCIFYFSQEKFPGGYAWLFPKGNGTANIGLGISGKMSRKKTASIILQTFIHDNFPNAAILSKSIGGVPCADRMAKISGAGIVLAGDAAFQSNPLSGGGIISGMIGGKIAGQIASQAVKNGKNSAHFLEKYEKEWDRALGHSHRRYYKLKEAINKFSDDHLINTANMLQKIPPHKHTLTKIFQTALRNQPSLLVDIIKLLSPFS